MASVGVHPYDAIVLDLMLPGKSGLELLETWRRRGDLTPVLILTALASVADRVRGLALGADDYLVKPFAFPELLARVRSLLRRDSRAVSSVTVVGELEVDDARHEAKRGSRRLDLTAKEFALLRYFMLHAGEVISQETLLEHVWDEHADPFTNTVRVTVGTLRRKVSIDDETPLIETVIGSGYRLLDP
jgi:DNA-binding response OmpR family regulator